jgi:hypothetical protein
MYMGFDFKQQSERLGPPVIATGIAITLLLFSAIRGGNEFGSNGNVRSAQANQSAANFLTTDGTTEIAFEALEGAVFFSVGNRLFGLPLSTTGVGLGNAHQEIELPAEPTFLVPTPGGVSVFVGFPGISEVYVYSAQDFSLQARISTEIVNPEAMSFSPTGEQAFIFWDQGRKVTEFSHSRLTLTHVGTRDLNSGEDRFIANRRGTRFFRAESLGLRVHLAQQLVDADFWETQVSVPVFDPGYTEIWGIGQDSTVQVIDERTGRNIRRFQQSVRFLPGVVTDRISFLSADGTQILQYFPRRSTEPRIISLPEPVMYLTRGAGQSLITITSQGTVYSVSQTGRVEETMLDLNINDSLARSLVNNSGVGLITTAIVRQDGSFACF